MREREVLFGQASSQVLYCYGINEDLFWKMEQRLSFVEFHEGLPFKGKTETLI